MTLASEVEAIGGLLKKYYESGPAKKQFFDDNLISKRLYKNTRDIFGGTATVGLHVGRNAGVGSAANGADYGTPSKQTFNQTTIPLRYTYMPFRLSGPDIENSKGNAAAFANVMTANADGAIADGKREINRQLFGDGSGILAFASANHSTVTQNITPYLWGDASLYLPAGKELQCYSITDGSTSKLTANARATSLVVSSCTSSVLTSASDTLATSAAGDAIGTYGALQVTNGTAFSQYEMMGLAGAIHNTDLIGSTDYKYDAGDAGNTAQINYINAEIAAITAAGYDWAGPTSAGDTNTFQGLATASYSWWKSLVYGNSGVTRAVSFSLLDKMIANLKVMRGSKLSAIYTTWQINQKIVDLIRADRRYPDTMEIDGGLKVNSYQGIPIIVDQDCPRGTMFFVDESEFALYEKNGFSFITDAKGNNMFKISGYDGYEVTGKVYANLGCMSRWKQGKIIDILES